MNIHKEEKKCSCEHCGTTFKKKQNLELHLKNVHEGIKEFKCQTCSKTFTAQSSLKRHLKAVHKENKEIFFNCDLCDFQAINKRKIAIIHNTSNILFTESVSFLVRK